jgi:hypothetical protein
MHFRDGVTHEGSGSEMSSTVRLALVAAGYVGAFLVASAVVAIRVANTSGPEAQASSGMYAFGDAFLFVLVFGLLALVPTCAALYFLRSYRRLWVALSVVGVVVAFTGTAAVSLYAFGRDASIPSTLATLAAISVLRILLAPILVPAFLLFGLLSPHRFPRIALLAATLMELAVAAYAGFAWILPMVLGRI